MSHSPTSASPESASAEFPAPLRMELAFVLPGTPEQVWEAIATANGLNTWMLRTDIDERVGGAICFHMGEETSSPGVITGFEPPRRFAYVELEWASLVGRDPGSVGPLATEFLIEAQSGGTCLLRVVTSAFGTGAEWEQEFFTDMEHNWRPQFDTLRLYLSHFAGQQVAAADIEVSVPAPADVAWARLRQALDATTTGPTAAILGLTATLERSHGTDGPNEMLYRTHRPMPGLVSFAAWGGDTTSGGDSSTAVMAARFFSDDAAAYIADNRAAWRLWLASLIEVDH